MESSPEAYILMMEKIKFLLLISLGLFCFSYNLLRFGIPSLSKEAVSVLLQGQLGTGGKDSLLGVVFDCLLRFGCNVDIKDLKTYFRMFGV